MSNKNNSKKYPNPLLKTILEKREIEYNGVKHKIRSNIKLDEGRVLYDLIVNNKMSKTMEIGLANGVSALFICQALKDVGTDGAAHLALDPFQTEQWKDIGVKNIEKAGLTDYFSVIQEKSEYALPVIAKKQAGTFDLIFIDGWHTFDNTLIDFFYANLCLKVGGYIVIDDVLHKGVGKVVRYIDSNYKHYKKIHTGVKTNAVYKKLGEDTKEWFFHKNF